MADSHGPVSHLEGAVTQPLTQYTRNPHLHGTPAQQPNPEPAEVSEPIDSLDQAEPQEPSPFADITILLVDDDPDIRALTRTFLEHIGFRRADLGRRRPGGPDLPLGRSMSIC